MTVGSFLGKLGLLALAAAIIGLPMIHAAQVCVFLGLMVWVMLGAVRLPDWRRDAPWLAGIAALMAAGLLLPAIQVQEGHNLFLVDGQADEAALKAALPAEVYEQAKAEFLRFYPPSEACQAEAACWRNSGVIAVPFAFSPDGALQSPAMSKLADFPEFEGLTQFRAGFRNAQGTAGIPSTNWYDWESGPGDPIRAAMPFFVVYELPAALVGLDLCWTGERYFAAPGKPAVHEASRLYECHRVVRDDVGGHYYGLSIDPRQTLGVRTGLKATLPVVLHALKLAARLAAVLGLVWLLIVPAWAELLTLSKITAPVALAVGWPLYRAFELQFFKSGKDPLLHWGFGQRILQEAAAGHWWEAMRGSEDVFYFMPGYRYFRAFEMVLFGDSGFLSYAALMAYPYLIFRLARAIGGERLALASLPVGFVAFTFAATGLLGWAEGVAYPLAVLAISLLAGEAAGRRQLSAGNCFAAAVILAVAILLRPNLVTAGLAAMLVAVLLGPTGTLWQRALAAALGLAPVGLLLIHNLAYGHSFVLATSAATIKDNLAAAPSAYGRAALALLTGHGNSPDVAVIGHQLKDWLFGEGGLPLIAMAVLTGLGWGRLGGTAAREALAGQFRQPGQWLAWSILAGLEVPLLFYTANGRYAYLACVLGTLLAIQLALDLAGRAGIRLPAGPNLLKAGRSSPAQMAQGLETGR